MIRFLLSAALLALPMTVAAQDAPKADAKAGKPVAVEAGQENAPQDPPKRVRSVLLYGDQTCPKPTTPDEVVVCAKDGDSPYRLPEKMRPKPSQSGNQAWANRTEDMMEANRAGLPNSCSAIGSGGQSGCTQQMLREWQAARREKRADDSQIP